MRRVPYPYPILSSSISFMELTFKLHRTSRPKIVDIMNTANRARVDEGEGYKCSDNLPEVSSTLIALVETSNSLTEFNREFDNDEYEAFNDSVGIQSLLYFLTATTQ